MVEMEFKVRIDLTGKHRLEHDAIVARLLREVADKVEQGTPFGGFGDSKIKGGFSYRGIRDRGDQVGGHKSTVSAPVLDGRHHSVLASDGEK